MSVICDYCERVSTLIDSGQVLGLSKGMIYYCEPCHAWTFTNKGVPLGRFANAELRAIKSETWKFIQRRARAYNKKNPKATNDESVIAVYGWLSDKMKIEPDVCGVDLFDLNECVRAFTILRLFS